VYINNKQKYSWIPWDKTFVGKKASFEVLWKTNIFVFIKKIPAKSLFYRACSATKRRKTNENVCVIPLHETSRWEGWNPINQAKGNVMSVGWGRLVSNPFSRNWIHVLIHKYNSLHYLHRITITHITDRCTLDYFLMQKRK
jgi:hypothetical protein